MLRRRGRVGAHDRELIRRLRVGTEAMEGSVSAPAGRTALPPMRRRRGRGPCCKLPPSQSLAQAPHLVWDKLAGGHEFGGALSSRCSGRHLSPQQIPRADVGQAKLRQGWMVVVRRPCTGVFRGQRCHCHSRRLRYRANVPSQESRCHLSLYCPPSLPPFQSAPHSH